jgi:putative flippase GtrA
MIDLHQMAAYLVVGGLVTLADIVLYGFLTGERFRMPRVRANVISVSCGMMLGFTLHFALVFHPHEAHVPSRILKYILTMLCSLYGVQNVVIYGMGKLWRGPIRQAQGLVKHLEIARGYSDTFIDRITGKVAATLVGMVWNFLLFKYFVYA